MKFSIRNPQIRWRVFKIYRPPNKPSDNLLLGLDGLILGVQDLGSIGI